MNYNINLNLRRMKRVILVFIFGFPILFSQCTKEQSLSELISAEEINYEKIETSWVEGCDKELIEWMDEEHDQVFKIVRQGLYPYSADIGVIRLDSHCGDYPTLAIFMDCEDSSPITGLLPHIYANPMISFPEQWLVFNGIIKRGSDIEMFFCLVPHAANDWPNVRIHSSQPWGVLSVNGANTIANNNVPYDVVYRFFDNEDKNRNAGSVSWYESNGTKRSLALYPGNASGFSTNGIWQGKDTRLAFVRKTANPNSYGSNINKTNFPNLGFRYAVFSEQPVLSNRPVGEVLIDDEDKNNTNSWGYNTLPTYRDERDYGFIKGYRNTHLFVTPVY